MPDNFVTFKKFPEAFLAEDVKTFLQQNSISCIIKQASSGLDNNFAGELLKDYEVQLAPVDFERAEKLLEDKQAMTLTIFRTIITCLTLKMKSCMTLYLKKMNGTSLITSWQKSCLMKEVIR